MLKALDDHARTNYQCIFTRDESWTICDAIPSKTWAMHRDHRNPILRPSHHIRKTIVTVDLGVNGIGRAKILPDRQKVTSEDFKNEILCAIYRGSLGIEGI
jgi:hypothetical protein